MEFHWTAFATATDCRWPPESVATGRRIDGIVVTASDFSVSAVFCSIAALVEDLRPVDLAAEKHVLDDVEVVAESEVLVDDLDPEPCSILRPVNVDGRPLEEDLAAVGGVRAGHALDERRLAGTVVADECHHLAAPHLEVDVGQRLHRPEGLRNVPELEDWRAGVGHDPGRSKATRKNGAGGGSHRRLHRTRCSKMCPPSSTARTCRRRLRSSSASRA